MSVPMISGKKMVKVGTSHALIIPAKTMKKMRITEDTVFDIDDEGDVLILRPRNAFGKRPVLPKLSAPAELDEGLKFLLGSVSFSEEELLSDERLRAISES